MSKRDPIVLTLALALSLACGTVASITPTPQPLSPTPTLSALSRAILASQSVAPTTPAGFTLEDEDRVGISIARPTDWVRDAGTTELPTSGQPVDHVVYAHVEPGIVQMMSIQTLSNYYPYESDTDRLKQILGMYAQRAAEVNLKVLDFADEVTVAGRPAQAMSYRLDDQRSGLPLFSIILVLAMPDNTAVVLQWAANESRQEETTDLFLKMLPTVRLLP